METVTDPPVDPEEVRMDEPLEVTSQFLEGLRKKDWKAMSRLSQKSWRMPWTAKLLAEKFSGIEMVNYELVGILRKSKVSAVTYWNLYTVEKGDLFKTFAVARVFCESAPNRTDLNGEWGVNPVTFACEEKEPVNPVEVARDAEARID